MIILGMFIKADQIESARLEGGTLHVDLISGRGWKWQNVSQRTGNKIIREIAISVSLTKTSTDPGGYRWKVRV